MSEPIQDPLAHASAVPDVAALIAECEAVGQGGLANLQNVAAAEDVQFSRRVGKSNPPDGKRWQKNTSGKDVVRPYDGAPDADVHLADELVLAEVDIFMMALEMAQFGTQTTHLNALTAAQSGELRAVAEWCRKATAEDMQDDGELLAQMTSKLGWSVLNTGWLERWELVERNLDLESFITQVAGLFGPDQARQLYTAILDPTLEDLAVAAVQKLFTYLPPDRTRQIVEDLRTTQMATFLDRQIGEKRPTLRTLIQGLNYFVLGRAGRLSKARGHLVIEIYSQADLESTAASNGWNEEFVTRAIGTMGQFSALADGLRQKHVVEDQESTERQIEIWTTTVYQYDETIKAGGYYFTVLSPHLAPVPGTTVTEADYAKHALLAYACGAPFVQSRRMVEGPGLEDSRGVSEMVRSDQAIVKMLTDALIARAHLEVDPPRAFVGMGWSKVEGWNRPGARLENSTPVGADIKDLGPSRGNPAVGEGAIERVERTARRRFALPNTTDGSHPSAWQTRQTRMVKRFLTALGAAYTQLVVLCYQELNEQELAAIIGHWPQLTLDDVLRHRVTLGFDVRGLDNDWRKDTLDTMIQLLQIDKGGSIDTGLLIQLIGSLTDPTIMSAVTRDPAGASAAMYRKVQNDINDIMLGNPPPLVEMDATAGMQLKMAFQIIGQNEDYQQELQQDPKKAQNLKTYIQNLQHSEQETQISPQQGRLGVAAPPQRPVQKGTPQLPA